MVDEVTIKAAKDTDLNKIIDEFQWERGSGSMIRCPSPDHDDNRPSCSYFSPRNMYKCFSCGRRFDAIDLYQCLSEKIDGRVVPFYRAVEEVLALDGETVSSTVTSNYNNQFGNYQGMNGRGNNGSQGNNSSPYDIVLNNSRPLTGYELNYLQGRGIMLYDSYVYESKVHTVQGIEKALQETADQQEIQRLNDIRDNGTFYKGIAHILKANRIQIRHNYWQGVNSILYNIDYDYDNDEDLQKYSVFLESTEHRSMAVQKSLDDSHTKRALGTSDFIWIAEGMGNKHTEDVYVCEGMEDALSYTMNGKRSISLNSIENIKSLIHYLTEDYMPYPKERFVISLDHDERGQKAAQELKQFFESYNQNPQKRYKYKYAMCSYPQQFHDINDYWVSKVFQK